MAINPRPSYMVWLSNSFIAGDPTSFNPAIITNPQDAEKLWLTPKSMQFGWGLNKPGTARVTALKRTTAAPMTMRMVEPGRTALWIQRDHRLVWGGLVWDVTSDAKSPDIEFTCEEFTSYYAYVRMDWVVPQTAVGTIQTMRNLISQTGTSGGLAMGVITTPVTNGFVYSPQWYEYEDRMVLDLIKELQSIGQHQTLVGVIPTTPTEGFEWTQEIFVGDTSEPETVIQQAVWRVWAPTAGTERDFPTVEWGEGTKETAHDLTWSRSARQMANRVKVKGRGTRGEQQRITVGWSGYAPTGHPRIDRVFQDTDLAFASQVEARARDIINRIATPPLQVKAVMVPGPHFPWDSTEQFPIRVGDRLPVRIRDYDIEVNDRLRVTAMDVTLSPAGEELVTLGMQPWLPGVGSN